MNYNFEKYKLTFSELIDHEIYDDSDCYGITFKLGNNKYTLNHNKIGWSRIFLTENGMFKDIPFTDDTIKILPKEIRVEKL